MAQERPVDFRMPEIKLEIGFRSRQIVEVALAGHPFYFVQKIMIEERQLFREGLGVFLSFP